MLRTPFDSVTTSTKLEKLTKADIVGFFKNNPMSPEEQKTFEENAWAFFNYDRMGRDEALDLAWMSIYLVR